MKIKNNTYQYKIAKITKNSALLKLKRITGTRRRQMRAPIKAKQEA